MGNKIYRPRPSPFTKATNLAIFIRQEKRVSLIDACIQANVEIPWFKRAILPYFAKFRDISFDGDTFRHTPEAAEEDIIEAGKAFIEMSKNANAQEGS